MSITKKSMALTIMGQRWINGHRLSLGDFIINKGIPSASGWGIQIDVYFHTFVQRSGFDRRGQIGCTNRIIDLGRIGLYSLGDIPQGKACLAV